MDDLEAAAERRHRSARGDVADHVRSVLRRMLRPQQPTLEAVARELDHGPRALQRRLRDEDTSFKALLDEVRHELAVEYLRDPHRTVAEVGSLLGFANRVAFTRAFKRWTAESPSQFRRRLS